MFFQEKFLINLFQWKPRYLFTTLSKEFCQIFQKSLLNGQIDEKHLVFSKKNISLVYLWTCGTLFCFSSQRLTKKTQKLLLIVQKWLNKPNCWSKRSRCSESFMDTKNGVSTTLAKILPIHPEIYLKNPKKMIKL